MAVPFYHPRLERLEHGLCPLVVAENDQSLYQQVLPGHDSRFVDSIRRLKRDEGPESGYDFVRIAPSCGQESMGIGRVNVTGHIRWILDSCVSGVDERIGPGPVATRSGDHCRHR